MGQYRIRKAKPGETPGYYTREQLAMQKFAGGGSTSDVDLSSLVPQLASSFAQTILQDSDPENYDIRPLMSQKAKELQQSGIDPDAIETVVNAAGKQALQYVANMMSQEEEDTQGTAEIPVVDNITDTGEDTEETTDYGYADDSVASDNGEDDEMINDMLMQSNAVQDQPEAQMGFEVDSPDEYAAFAKYMQYGGSSGKRKFIKEKMNEFAKAAEGMEQRSSTASLRGTATDPNGKGLTSKDTFVPAVKQTAQNAVNKKMAEEQYETMMNQQFQFGGANRRIRRANRAMFGVPFAPPGVSADYKFGLLGGLRSANVSWDPRMMQGMFGFSSIMPGMNQSSSGGWYSPTYKIKGTRTKSASETPTAIDAKAVNSEALDKVAKDTPNSDATSAQTNAGQTAANAAMNSGLDANNPNSGSTPGTANAELNQGTAGDGTSNDQRETVIQPKKKKDAWGRTEGDQWFGYDPNTKVERDEWGRPKGSKWYGFDPVANSYISTYDESAPKQKQLGAMNKNEYSAYMKDKYGKPQMAYADDELIQDLVLGVPGIKDALTFLPRVAGSMGSRLFSNGPKGLPNSQRQIGSSQKQIPGGNNQTGYSNKVNPTDDFLYGKDGMPAWRSGFLGNTITEGNLQGFINATKAGKSKKEIANALLKKKKKQTGGAISPDLYKYIYGGNDIDQYDIDFTNSKDVTDPYFQYGGLYRFEGEEDSEVKTGQNVGLTKEDVQKMFEEYSKKQNPQQQMYNQQQYYPGSFGSAGAGQPMWGRPSYAPGYSGRLGQYGNLFGFMTKDFDYYTPYSGGKQGNIAVNPMQAYGASLANIQKSGMIPTSIKYSKERKQDGNWFERKLGFNKDRVTTINFAKPGTFGQGQPSNDLDNNGIPDNVQSNPLDPNIVKQQGQGTGTNQPNANPNQPQGSNIYSNTEGLSNRTQRQIRRGERRTAREVGRGEDMMDNESMTNQPASSQPTTNQPRTYRPKPNTGSGMYNVSEGIEGPPVNPNIPANKPNTPMYKPGMNTGSGMYNVSGEFEYGGYMPEFAFQDGGFMPEYLIAGEVNNQLPTAGDFTPDFIKNPLDSKLYAPAPEKECTDEEKQNPASPCYEKDTEQIKVKKETAKTFHPDRLANALKAGARSFVTNVDQLQGFKNNYVPGMQNLAYANQKSRERIETGPWEENTGTFNKMGFEGVVKKGGTTGLRKNGEYQLTMDEIREILKAGGKVEFL